MSKEIEIMAEERERLIQEGYADCYIEECDLVIKALQRLEAIDNAEPSEALECSLKLYKMVESAGNGNGFSLNEAWKYHTTIKQALLKAQDLEEQLGCPLEVFVKALKNGIYHNNKFEYPVLILDKDNFKTKNYHLLIKGTIVYLKDYKETWWLKKDKSE